MKPFVFLLILISAPVIAQEAQLNPGCEEVKKERMTFLSDGSFTSEEVLIRNLRVLKSCGLDDYDISFFGNMDYMSGMLKNLTQSKVIEQVTYGDLMQKIQLIVSTEKYKKVKTITLRSEELGKRVGNEQTWAEDREIFRELGASQRIIEAVGNYLKEHPNNLKNYREILELMN